MQATTAGADQTFRLDDLFETGKMLRKGAAIGRAWPVNPVPGGSIRLVFGMDVAIAVSRSSSARSNWSGSVFSDLRPKAACLKAATSFSSRSIPSSLRAIWASLPASLSRAAIQHRLQGGNIVGKIGGIKHDQKLPNPDPFCLRNLSS